MDMKLKLTPFARAAFIRAVKTMAQTALSLLGVGALMSDIDWIRVLSASALSGIMSVLTSVATDLPEAPAAGGDVSARELSAADAIAFLQAYAAKAEAVAGRETLPETPVAAEGGTPS